MLRNLVEQPSNSEIPVVSIDDFRSLSDHERKVVFGLADLNLLKIDYGDVDPTPAAEELEDLGVGSVDTDHLYPMDTDPNLRRDKMLNQPHD